MIPPRHLTLVAFASATHRPLITGEMDLLLTKWRVRNARFAVTGMLLHHDDSFFQILEGFTDSIEGLASLVELDPHHHRVTRLLCEPTSRRVFGDWSMGFARVSRNDIATIPGFEPFVATGGRYWQLDSTGALALLAGFRDGPLRRAIA